MNRYLLALLMLVTFKASGSDVILAEVTSDLVPSPVEYAVLAPTGYTGMKDLPLILVLHGGGGSRDMLLRQQALFDELWASGDLPPALLVTPSVAKRGFYMDFKDGSERWERFLVDQFISHLQTVFHTSSDPKRTFIMGTSMGGMGALRIAFKYPDRFGAVAALEPGIEPVLAWSDIRMKHRFFRSDAVIEQAFGRPVDAVYWAANNPATIATQNAPRLASSGLQIYFEAGDEDEFWLYEGSEFLHRVLWDQKIKHEYHLIRGAGHVDPSLETRTAEAVRFLIRSYKPWDKASVRLRAAMLAIEAQKLKSDEKDHYNQK